MPVYSRKVLEEFPPHTSPAVKQKYMLTEEDCEVWCELEFQLPPSLDVLESSI